MRFSVKALRCSIRYFDLTYLVDLLSCRQATQLQLPAQRIDHAQHMLQPHRGKSTINRVPTPAAKAN